MDHANYREFGIFSFLFPLSYRGRRHWHSFSVSLSRERVNLEPSVCVNKGLRFHRSVWSERQSHHHVLPSGRLCHCGTMAPWHSLHSRCVCVCHDHYLLREAWHCDTSVLGHYHSPSNQVFFPLLQKTWHRSTMAPRPPFQSRVRVSLSLSTARDGHHRGTTTQCHPRECDTRPFQRCVRKIMAMDTEMGGSREIKGERNRGIAAAREKKED